MGAEQNNRELINRLLGPSERQVTCEECFKLLDQYVDAELSGKDAGARFPAVRAHFEGCPACGEDHQSLRDFVVWQSSGG